jgi:hypothetical protein
MLPQECLHIAEPEADVPAEVVGGQLAIPDKAINGVRVDREEGGQLLPRQQRLEAQLGRGRSEHLRPQWGDLAHSDPT